MNCIDLAQRTRIFFEENHRNLNLHFISNFPHNSCETSSLLLGKVLFDTFPQKHIFFVVGTNSSKFERHFWIEVQKRTFDITADQFENITKPIYGKTSQIITNRFDNIQKVPINEALNENKFATSRVEEFNQIVDIILTSDK